MNSWISARGAAWILAAAGLVYTFICTFPGDYTALDPGLDSSWMFALSLLAESRTYLFGKDIVFTYGPLGFLLAPREAASGVSFTLAAVFWCVLHVSLFTVLACRLRRNLTTPLLVCGAWFTLAALGLWQEHRFLFIAGAFAMLSLEKCRTAWFFGVAGTLLGSIALLMKIGLGISVLSAVLGSWLLLIKDNGREYRKTLLAGGISLAVSLLLVALVIFRTPASLWRWVSLSREVIAGYGPAMSLDGSPVALLLAVTDAVCLVCLYFLLTASTRRCLWLLLGVLFIAFKEGFVRQDGHRMAYFTVVAMLPVLLLLSPAITGRDKWRMATAFVFLTAIAIAYACNFVSFPALRLAEVRSFVSMEQGLRNMRRLASLHRTRELLRAAAFHNLRPSVVPESWQKRFDNLQSVVSILPSELSMAAANHMQWKPIATLQLYAAYTPVLDQATAASLAGVEYLIVSYEGIDGRNPILDTPLTWRVVAENYTFADADPDRHRILLVRKAPQPELVRPVSEGRAAMYDWVSVRESTHLLYTSLRLDYTLIGELAKVAYRIPALYIELARQSGRVDKYRLLSSTAVSGILINYPPGNQYELENLFRAQAMDPVVRFRIVPPDSPWYFRNRYSWRLLESSRSMATPAVRPQPPGIPDVQPATGQGRTAVFEITAFDPNGARDIRLIQLLINRDLNGVSACYVSYEVAEERLWLIADAGTGSAGFGHPGEQAMLANSQCGIPLNRASARLEDNRVVLRIPVEFNASLSGAEHLYVYALNRNGLHTEWQARAVWEVK